MPSSGCMGLYWAVLGLHWFALGGITAALVCLGLLLGCIWRPTPCIRASNRLKVMQKSDQGWKRQKRDKSRVDTALARSRHGFSILESGQSNFQNRAPNRLKIMQNNDQGWKRQKRDKSRVDTALARSRHGFSSFGAGSGQFKISEKS